MSAQTNTYMSIDSSQLRSSLAEIQDEIKRVFAGIRAGKILESFDILSKVTDAVVVSCEALGLATEKPVMETFDRKAFWLLLNRCWLVSLQHVTAAKSDEDRLREEHIVHLQQSVVHWGDALEKVRAGGLRDGLLGIGHHGRTR
ncbi:hypothetical protein DL89DRAFT_259253 [Linderina pennispora]|uniref:Uncharacterized protein n=1 Tax=Linderina pennispora TaxID=61395 RepID=A0A1Y1W4E2_9FUNG|nr:uncharacterized protein DL89DRAFT_259253 [Linderina pennispora]ORX68034.1 hypothetical protein DL89DRAFT_259253 [Linderina pennispora]